MSNPAVRLLQITDTHLYADENDTLMGFNTQQSFAAVVQAIKEETQTADAIFLTGDLSQDHSEKAYQRLADTVADFNTDSYWIPGNHDDLDKMYQTFAETELLADKHFVAGDWLVILLCSNKPGYIEGELNADQLQHLQRCLAQYPQHHTLVVLHHHPIDCGSQWLDTIGLDNSDDFHAIIKDNRQVRGVVFGHIHQVVDKTIDGVRYFSTPSTCVQFTLKGKEFGLDSLTPGYRWITLYADGTLETEVKRLASYDMTCDENASGY